MQCHRLLGHRGAPSLDLRVRRRQRDPVVRIGIPYRTGRSTAPRDCHKRVSRMRSGRKSVGPSRVSSALIIGVHADEAKEVNFVRRKDLGQDLIIDVLSGCPHRFDC